MAKELIFGGVATLIAFIYSALFHNFAITGNYYMFLASLVIAVCFLAAFLIQVVIVKESRVAIGLMVLESLAFALPFIVGGFSFWHLTLALIIFLLFGFSYWRGRENIMASLNLRLLQLRREVLFYAAIGLIIFSIGGYLTRIDINNFQISRNTIALAVQPVSWVIEKLKIIEDFSFDQEVGSALKKIAVKQSEVAPEPVDQQTLINNLHRYFSELIDAPLELSQNLIDSIQIAINKKLAASDQQSLLQIIGIFSFFAFVITVGLVGFINLVAALLAWAIFQLLLALKFVYISVKDANQEIVNL